jgi:hypothetical protein
MSPANLFHIAATLALSTALFSTFSFASALPISRRQQGPPGQTGSNTTTSTTTADGTCLANDDWKDINPTTKEGFFSCFSHSVNSDGTADVYLSNVPDHVLVWDGVNPGDLCQSSQKITLPKPVKTENNTGLTQVGAIAISVNGVQIFGPAEGGGENAVGSGLVNCAGHPQMEGLWHYHHPEAGCVTSSSTTLVAWALDGFPIYGPLDGTKEEVDAVLDDCNGLDVADSEYGYQYHVRSRVQVDETLTNNTGPNNTDNWKYFLGCYRGASVATEFSISTGICTSKSDDSASDEVVNTTDANYTGASANLTNTTNSDSTSSTSIVDSATPTVGQNSSAAMNMARFTTLSYYTVLTGVFLAFSP